MKNETKNDRFRRRWAPLFRMVAFLGLLALSQVSSAPAGTVVSADHEHFQYVGRIDMTERKAPVITWPGTQIRARFTGTSVSVRLDDQNGENFFNVFVDGEEADPVVIDCEKGERDYPVVSGLEEGPHTLLIFKRTEGEEGSTVFRGLVLDRGAKLQAPPERPERRIEFIGDSITCGMANEAPLKGKDKDVSQKNNYLAYGAITARELDAEYHCIAKSGIGIMISWFDFTMPDYFEMLDATRSSRTRWDFEKWVPQVVVINLFQNDSWLVRNLNPVPDEERRVRAYYDFLSSVRGHYPDAFIVCTLGSMDATRKGSKWPDYIRKAVARREKRDGDGKLGTLFFPFTGYGPHPRVQHHRKNAEMLIRYLREKMDW